MLVGTRIANACTSVATAESNTKQYFAQWLRLAWGLRSKQDYQGSPVERVYAPTRETDRD